MINIILICSLCCLVFALMLINAERYDNTYDEDDFLVGEEQDYH